jgi:hypothetical protein
VEGTGQRRAKELRMISLLRIANATLELGSTPLENPNPPCAAATFLADFALSFEPEPSMFSPT